MFTCQCKIKEARKTYLFELVTKPGAIPESFCETINYIIGPVSSQPVQSTPEDCGAFPNYFKLVNITIECL